MMPPHLRAEALREMAPSGVVRVALNTANAATVMETATGFEGPAPRLIEALRIWTGLPVAVTQYRSAGQVVAGAAAWDVAFLAIDPARAENFRFSIPYLSIEATAAVRAASAILSVEELDAPDVRIASSEGAAYDLVLQRTLRHATRIAFANPPASFDGFEAQQLEAVVGIRQTLARALADRPDLRLLPGRIAVIEHALAVPGSRTRARDLLDDFVSDAASDTAVITPPSPTLGQ